MKPYRILKTFKGSQTGNDSDEFVADTIRELSDDLAAIVVKEKWAAPVEQSLPERRETKVVQPEETKPADVSLKGVGQLKKGKK